MAELVDQTEDITLLTDGERRYGNILFEICHELLRTGKPGRPRKTLKKGSDSQGEKQRVSSTQKGAEEAKISDNMPTTP